ncbi:MAG: hypothetical protein ACM3KM_00330 [Acidobacteriaceae bacterium]
MKVKKQTSETQEISIKLEQYDDIFSDFDIRSYSKRSLSVDFLEEIKRAAVDKDLSGVEMVLHLPKDLRDKSHERTIKDRLFAHFKKHYLMLLNERARIMQLGIKMVILGLVSMVIATFILYQGVSRNLFLSFLVIFLEPAAWFLLWEGMDQIIFNSKNVKSDLDFYRKMSHPKAKIVFESY